MIEKITSVKNPLTIIAIFAAIAEISGTFVLPLIAEPNQAIYIWFLMLFPSGLVVAFFATLHFNNKVLYAPSDFKNEENFLAAFQKNTAEQKQKQNVPLNETITKLDAERRPESSIPGLSETESEAVTVIRNSTVIAV